MRLEKLIYEKVVNSSKLGRNRKIMVPRKLNYVNPNFPNKYNEAMLMKNPILSAIYNVLVPIGAYFNYNWDRDYITKQGLTWDDCFLYEEHNTRRNELHLTIMTQSYNN